MNKNLNKKSKTGVIWDLSGSFVKQIIFLLVTIVLARILGPEEYGIIGMAIVFIHISAVFIDAGFTSGLIQQKDTKEITLSSIFFVNMAISIIVSIIIIISSPYIAEFYEEPRIKDILEYLAIIPPLAALGRVQAAILTKEIDFKSLSIRDIISALVGGALGVVAALLDFGVYSLVIQQIATVASGTLMLWYATKWKPKFEFSLQEVKNLFSYSSFVFLDSIMRQVFNKIDTIFIGKVFSPIVLGYYSRAETLRSQVITYTTSSLNKVIFPVFSHLQDDDAKFKTVYFKAFNIVSGLIILIIAPLYFLADFIIILLLGKQWEQSIILFQILLLTALASPQVNLMGRAVLAKGFSKLKFKVGLLQRLLKLLPIVVGLYYGINEFAIAMVISSFLVFFVLSLIYQIKLSIKFWIQVKNLIVPYILFFLMLIFDVMTESLINQWLMVFIFLTLQILFFVLIKHESYLFVYGIVEKYRNKK